MSQVTVWIQIRDLLTFADQPWRMPKLWLWHAAAQCSWFDTRGIPAGCGSVRERKVFDSPHLCVLGVSEALLQRAVGLVAPVAGLSAGDLPLRRLHRRRRPADNLFVGC